MKIKADRVCVGDVIENNGIKMVCIKIDNREKEWYCSYDRTYFMVDYNELKENMTKRDVHIYDNFSKRMEIRMLSTDNPFVEKCDNVTPFGIKHIDAFVAREKETKVKIEYE